MKVNQSDLFFVSYYELLVFIVASLSLDLFGFGSLGGLITVKTPKRTIKMR